MRLLQVLGEIGVIMVVVWVLAAVLALPLWGLITTFLWPAMGYQGALAITATVLLGVCFVLWVIELAKGVRI